MIIFYKKMMFGQNEDYGWLEDYGWPEIIEDMDIIMAHNQI
jgi:hypothetical protein